MTAPDLTAAELDALEALEKRATPGEWAAHTWIEDDGHAYRAVGPSCEPPAESDDRAEVDGEPGCAQERQAYADAELLTGLRNAAPRLIAMARRATSSGEWLNRMAEAVGYTGAAHPADVLQRIDDAVAAESRVRELEAERDEYKAQNSVPGILDEVENPAPIPVGAPGSNARRAWCLGRALQTAERELGETLDRAIGAEAERDAARKTIRDAVQWLEAYEPHLPSVLHNLRVALANGDRSEGAWHPVLGADGARHPRRAEGKEDLRADSTI